ncbi:MAG TPA: family 16 glycoside hydrolase, partial [Lacipirellulaceae bacterium]|nr:family 16 glycoside hydrolase [Lacipirellulaceae bacterium]
NTVELIVHGSNGSEHIINGHPVLRMEKLRRLVTAPNGAAGGAKANAAPPDKAWAPLGHGRIAIQAEFAEVYYRNIEIKPIPEGPLLSK